MIVGIIDVVLSWELGNLVSYEVLGIFVFFFRVMLFIYKIKRLGKIILNIILSFVSF